jgi:thioredoxin-like negative regulator of GroEL
MRIRDVTDREFDQVVERAGKPVLIEFWKPGCGSCQALTHVLEAMQKELAEEVLFLKMNVEENYQIPAELEISSLPTLALYREGSFERFIGGIGTRAEVLKQLRLEPRR